MATTTNLQKAQIISCENDIVRIKHPDIIGNLKTYLSASVAAAGITLTVKDTSGWADDDWFILGYPGDSQTEESDVNGAVSRGTSITITNSLSFSHDIDAPMTQIYERKIEVWGATTLAGSKTAIYEDGTSIDIQWDKPHTEIDVAGTQYAFYFVRFYDGSVDGEYSDGVARTGLGSDTVEEMIQSAFDLTGESESSTISREYLLREANNWQDDITSRRDWSFELVTEDTITTTTNENEYALSGLTNTFKHPNSDQSVVAVRFADFPLNRIDWHDYLDTQKGSAKTTVSSAITAADTSVTLTDTYEFNEVGTIIVGTDTVTYTANAESTGILTGIPASGTGSFASSHSVGDNVWQGASPAKPFKFVIYNDKIYLDVPVSSTYSGRKLKFEFYKALTRLSDFADTTDIPFTYLAQYFLAARIEYKKGNIDKGDHWIGFYEGKIKLEVRKDRQPSQKRWIPQADDTQFEGRRYRSSESSKYN